MADGRLLLVGGSGYFGARLAESIAAAAAPQPVTISYGEGTDAFRSPFTVDISRRAALGWTPSANIADEARRTIAAFAA